MLIHLQAFFPRRGHKNSKAKGKSKIHRQESGNRQHKARLDLTMNYEQETRVENWLRKVAIARREIYSKQYLAI